MKKVYIVKGGKYSDSWIVGVFSSKKGAVAHLEKQGAVYHANVENSLLDFWQDENGSYDIYEYGVQER